MLATVPSLKRFWICLLDNEAFEKTTHGQNILYNKNWLRGIYIFEWLLLKSQLFFFFTDINSLFKWTITTPTMCPYPATRIDLCYKSWSDLCSSQKSRFFCWKSTSFADSVSFWYSDGALWPHLSKRMVTVTPVPTRRPVFFPKQTVFLQPRSTSHCYIFLTFFDPLYTNINSENRVTSLIWEMSPGSPEIQSCVVAFPRFSNAEHTYLLYLQAAYACPGIFDLSTSNTSPCKVQAQG